MTVWGHLKVSPGAWALAQFSLAADQKVENQAAMVSLGRPGAGERLLESCGFADVRRVDIPFAWEFADPEVFARALASTGPAYEAIQDVGEERFHHAAVEEARQHLRNGLPLRAEIKVVGYLGGKTKRSATVTDNFLEEPRLAEGAQVLYDEDLAESGYVWNVSREWAYQPGTIQKLFELMSQAFKPSGLSFRQRGVLVAAASTLGDSYCSLAWGGKLSGERNAALAAGVLTGSDADLTEPEKAMAAWARKVVSDPNSTTRGDVQALRTAGLTDEQIFTITAFIALRLAFSSVNDALGAHPDAQLLESVAADVRAAVTFGRAPA